MDPIDQGIESVEHIQAELQKLMRRLVEVDPDAVLRIEMIFKEVRMEIAAHHTMH